MPPQYAVNGKLLENPVLQLECPGYEGTASVEDYSKHGLHGKIVSIDNDGNERRVLVMPRSTNADHPVDSIFVISGAEIPESPSDVHNASGRPKWIDPKPLRTRDITVDDLSPKPSQIRDSWEDRFHFKEEEKTANGEIEERGLRSPQIGALHATLAHWTVGSDPATVVMPTGTGKTETMLAVTAHECAERVLVIVPTSTLRDQIADTFVEWGILKEFGILDSAAEYPVVGKLEHTLENPQQVEGYFGCCNVVVATMSVLRYCSEKVRQAICDTCTHLFIDEAHHIVASSWERFRSRFINSGEEKPVLQFTATPYRSDGRHVAGEIIYNFPLRKAQEQGYFADIEFSPVREYRPSKKDESIAIAATKKLEEDLKKGRDHLLMARVSSISRAEDVIKLYKSLAPSHNPVVVHSGQGNSDQQKSTDALFDRDSRIVVCVDMFGEGFDLPELKIAALHDVHKSVGVTIQFTGRFARAKSNLGTATIIANIAEADVETAIQKLYAEDPDWNYLLRRITDRETEKQRRRSEFFETFGLPEELPVQNIFPKMSTVAYQTDCDSWRPERIHEGIPSRHQLYSDPIISQSHNTAVFVTKVESPVDWGEVKGFVDTTWHLYVLYWSVDQQLFYINSSNNNSHHQPIAESVCGNSVAIIRGENVFRSMGEVNRLRFLNVGLSHAMSRSRSFSMYTGANVGQGLSRAEAKNRYKTNLFGRGYEDGERTSIGCSRKGRMWSYRVAEDIQEWTQWCEHVGSKLLDDTISVEDILESAISVEVVDKRPDGVPLTIEWPSDLFLRSEERTLFKIDGEEATFLTVDLNLRHHDEDKPLQFTVSTESSSVNYEIRFSDEKVQYVPLNNRTASLQIGRSEHELSDWFNDHPPTIRFANTSWLRYNEYFKIPEGRRPSYDREDIEKWNWDGSGVDITQESQYKRVKQNGVSKLVKRSDSIQRHVIDKLLNASGDDRYDVVMDDDDKGEAADIVALRLSNRELYIHLLHCKFSSAKSSGRRIGDLYEVCGQAQKNLHWFTSPDMLFEHLKSRAGDRQDKYSVSRFERGDFSDLEQLQSKAPTVAIRAEVSIVQPGLDADNATEEQLDIIASTELYLRETYDVDFTVIAA